jgi:hypothetical protein
MLNRRDMLAAGLLGSIAPSGEGETQSSDTQALAQVLNRIAGNLDEIKASMEAGLRGNTMSYGSLGVIKLRLETWVRATGRFPEFWDVGISVFLEIYDWHIRQQQPIQISRIAEQRMAIQWMFTQYVLRWENEPNYIGQQPYDR